MSSRNCHRIRPKQSNNFHITRFYRFIFSRKSYFWRSSQDFAGYWTNGPLGRIFTRPIPDSDKANITIWINGDSCDQFVSQSREQAISNILSIYYSQVPEARGKVDFGEYIDWITNPFNEGAWAIWRPGDISRYADLLHKPSGRYFLRESIRLILTPEWKVQWNRRIALY